MSRFSCPCGLEAEVDADQMLDFIRSHDCAHHTAVPAPPSEPRTTGAAWAGVAETLLFVALALSLCVLCGWLVKA